MRLIDATEKYYSSSFQFSTAGSTVLSSPADDLIGIAVGVMDVFLHIHFYAF